MLELVGGTERFDSHAEVFHFKVLVDGEPISCAISQEAFEDLTGEGVAEPGAEAQFQRALTPILRLATKKLFRDGVNAPGAVTISARDVFESKMH